MIVSDTFIPLAMSSKLFIYFMKDEYSVLN